MKTKVIFRKFKDINKDVVALFPDEKYDRDRSGHNYCWSYMHVGQHGSADYHYVVSQSILAKPEEYQELKKELEDRGYDLVVKQRK